MGNEKIKKRICVIIPQKEHERLSRMAGETGRTAAGYLRWLLNLALTQKIQRQYPFIT